MKRLISKVKQVLFGAVVRTRARTVGKGLKVNRYSWVSKSVVLGDNVNFNGMRIVGEGEIRIGSNFHSGRGCSIIGSFHDFDYGDAVPYGMAKIDKDVVIEDNVWLGDQVIVLGGAHIGEGAVIPVSYTHLDVYKRQILMRRTAEDTFLTVSPHSVSIGLTNALCRIGIDG